MRAKCGQIERVNGLTKADKYFINIPSFRSILATITTPKYNVGKYLNNLILIKSSIQNDFAAEDSVEATN